MRPFFLLLLSTTALFGATLPLRMTGQSPTGVDLKELQTEIEVFHAAMVTLIEDPEFPSDAVSLNVVFDPEGSLGYVSMHGGWNADLSAFNGTLRIPPLEKFDGSAKSVWNVPMDRAYFMRLFLHELSPIYLSRFARKNGSDFYNRPGWIVQGSEEYFSHHATGNAPNKDPVLAILSQTSLGDLSYGLVLDNHYIDGYILFRFIHEQYGTAPVMTLITMNPSTTPKMIRAATGDAPDEFMRKFAGYMKDLHKARATQQADPANRASSGH